MICKMFIVFYTVKIEYICVFMTFPHPTVFVTHLWIYGMYACMYVRKSVHMYVCMNVCTYVCMYVHMYTCTHVCIYICMYIKPVMKFGLTSSAVIFPLLRT